MFTIQTVPNLYHPDLCQYASPFAPGTLRGHFSLVTEWGRTHHRTYPRNRRGSRACWDAATVISSWLQSGELWLFSPGQRTSRWGIPQASLLAPIFTVLGGKPEEIWLWTTVLTLESRFPELCHTQVNHHLFWGGGLWIFNSPHAKVISIDLKSGTHWTHLDHFSVSSLC